MSQTPSINGNCRFWKNLTATEIRAACADAVVVLPIASTEQHGNHLATGTDAIINDELQRRLVERPPPTGTYLLLPTLAIGSSDHHLAYGGTLSIPPILYAQLLRAALESLLQQGHRRIFVLNSHGGNEAPLQTALGEIAHTALKQGSLVAGVSYWHLCEDRWSENIPELKTSRMGHACELETSMIMASHPELSPEKRARDDTHGRNGRPHRWTTALPFNGLFATGTTGYPSLAQRKTGEALLSEAILSLREALNEFAAQPLPSDRTKSPGAPRTGRSPRF